jgi:hypothetical protein
VRPGARIVVLGVLLAASVACETDTPTVAERQAITAMIRPFLTQLAAAYAQSDPRTLEGVAAPRMLDDVRRGIETMQAGGRRLDPVLVSFEITDLKVLRHANAVVNCTEVWDTRSFDAFTGVLLGRDAHSVLHSHIQLKLVRHTWMVLYREVDETAKGPRLVLPTPTPR